jgi:hypothetical protein
MRVTSRLSRGIRRCCCRFQPPPRGAGFARGRHAGQRRHGARQVEVIDLVEDEAFDGRVESTQVGRHPGHGIGAPAHRHLDQVVVAVLAVALAVDPRVLNGRQVRALEPVPGAEMVLPGQLERAHGPK